MKNTHIHHKKSQINQNKKDNLNNISLFAN